MQTERTTALGPTLEEFERVARSMLDAHDDLERLSFRIDPVAIANGDERRTFKELGQLAAFVSISSAHLEEMDRLVGQLARARDAITPLDADL